MTDIVPTPTDSGKYRKRAIPAATRRAVAERFGASPGCGRHPAACAYCGRPGSIYWPKLGNGRPGAWVNFPDLELDHITPERSGGTSTPDNITLACRPCNRHKGAKVRV